MNNDFCHEWGDLPMISTSDKVLHVRIGAKAIFTSG